jgi:hypothetical protein
MKKETRAEAARLKKNSVKKKPQKKGVDMGNHSVAAFASGSPAGAIRSIR